MFQLFQDIPEPIRQRTLQFQRLPGGRVDEPEPAGVQALAGQSGPWLFAAVHRIPQQRMADGGQMDPNLVGTACFQPALHMGIARIAGQNGPVGHRLPAVFAVNGHLFPVHRMAADGSVHSATVFPTVSYTHLTLPTTPYV